MKLSKCGEPNRWELRHRNANGTRATKQRQDGFGKLGACFASLRAKTDLTKPNGITLRHHNVCEIFDRFTDVEIGRQLDDSVVVVQITRSRRGGVPVGF